MRNTAKILKRLIEKGYINDCDDAELFSYLSETEVQNELQDFAEEWSFYILQRQHDLYLLPLSDNVFMTQKLGDLRGFVGSNKRNADAYLQCYIIMVILWMIFRSKNDIEDHARLLRIKDIVQCIDERLTGENTATALDEHAVSYRSIADKWTYSLNEDDENSRKTKPELVRTACRFLEKNGLVKMYDEEDEVRPQKRLIDLMYGYYLKEQRVNEINELFERLVSDADN